MVSRVRGKQSSGYRDALSLESLEFRHGLLVQRHLHKDDVRLGRRIGTCSLDGDRLNQLKGWYGDISTVDLFSIGSEKPALQGYRGRLVANNLLSAAYAAGHQQQSGKSIDFHSGQRDGVVWKASSYVGFWPIWVTERCAWNAGSRCSAEVRGNESISQR